MVNDGPVLASPLEIGGTTKVRNRLYRAPVLEGAGSGPDAGRRYAKAFVPNAEAGVGLVIQGSACLYEEGRTSPGMTLVHERDRVLALAEMVSAVHAAGAAIWLQVGHGGIYAMEAWHEPYASQRKEPLLAASPLPMLLRPAFAGVPVHVMSTEEVEALCVRYGDVAMWAREAGYDGIQLGSANAKLLDQFLSPFYNRRDDEFGGSADARAHVLRRIREEIGTRAGWDFTVTVKLPAETAPPGMAHTSVGEALHLATLAEEFGYDAVTPVEVSVFPDTTLSRGGVPASLWRNNSMKARFEKASPSPLRRAVIGAGYILGGVAHPFRPVWNRDLFRAVKARVGVAVLAVGGIRTRAEADAILDGAEADMVGIGRPFYAEADLPAEFLAAGADPHLRCRNSNMCVPAQMLGMKGVCYNPAVKSRGSA